VLQLLDSEVEDYRASARAGDNHVLSLPERVALSLPYMGSDNSTEDGWKDQHECSGRLGLFCLLWLRIMVVL
jgi:hypothetical protein